MLKIHRPLRLAVLCSDRAPGLMYLLNQSPDRGFIYEIACVVTSSATFAEEVRVERRGIPTLAHPIDAFYTARGVTDRGDAETRRAYDAETVATIEPYFPDILVLDGYLYLVTQPLLNAFPNRIINLHFADLTRRRVDGGPEFPGIRAVRDALAAGCDETRATVHLVNERPDDGAPIVRSWPFAVSPIVGELGPLNTAFKAYVHAHQEWMIQTVSGPLIATALRLIAGGGVSLDDLAAARGSSGGAWILEQDGSMIAPAVHEEVVAWA